MLSKFTGLITFYFVHIVFLDAQYPMCLSSQKKKNLSEGNSVKMFNKSFENVVEFKYLGVAVTN